MGSLSNTYENHMLDSILGSDRSTRFPAIVYVALFTVMPTDSTFGTECTGGAYARVAVNNDDTNWPDAVASEKANGALITFPTLTVSWGTVLGWGILDHITNATAANIIVYNDLVSPITPLVGNTPEFPIGALAIGGD